MLTLSHQCSLSKKQSRNLEARQELMTRPWRSVADWLVSLGLLKLLSLIPQDHHPKDGTAPRGPGLPTSIIVKKMPCRFAYRQSDGEIFSIEGFLSR